MATRGATNRLEGNSVSVNPTVEQPRSRFNEMAGVYRTAKTSIPFAVLLIGWTVFWLVALRLLFVHERFLELAVSTGIMMLPIIGLLGWMAWKTRRMKTSRR